MLLNAGIVIDVDIIIVGIMLIVIIIIVVAVVNLVSCCARGREIRQQD